MGDIFPAMGILVFVFWMIYMLANSDAFSQFINDQQSRRHKK